jgi:hypothetical protein
VILGQLAELQPEFLLKRDDLWKVKVRSEVLRPLVVESRGRVVRLGWVLEDDPAAATQYELGKSYASRRDGVLSASPLRRVAAVRAPAAA